MVPGANIGPKTPGSRDHERVRQQRDEHHEKHDDDRPAPRGLPQRLQQGAPEEYQEDADGAEEWKRQARTPGVPSERRPPEGKPEVRGCHDGDRDGDGSELAIVLARKEEQREREEREREPDVREAACRRREQVPEIRRHGACRRGHQGPQVVDVDPRSVPESVERRVDGDAEHRPRQHRPGGTQHTVPRLASKTAIAARYARGEIDEEDERRGDLLGDRAKQGQREHDPGTVVQEHGRAERGEQRERRDFIEAREEIEDRVSAEQQRQREMCSRHASHRPSDPDENADRAKREGQVQQGEDLAHLGLRQARRKKRNGDEILEDRKMHHPLVARNHPFSEALACVRRAMDQRQRVAFHPQLRRKDEKDDQWGVDRPFHELSRVPHGLRARAISTII
jgi:hypothetical protein